MTCQSLYLYFKQNDPEFKYKNGKTNMCLYAGMPPKSPAKMHTNFLPQNTTSPPPLPPFLALCPMY